MIIPKVCSFAVAVAVAFFLCWAPFHAQRLMAVYGIYDSQVFNDIFHVLNYTSGVLYFLSTCINPLLYNIMSHKFREAFKVTLARHFGLADKYQTQSHNYSALMRQNGSMRLHTTVNNNFSSYRLPLQNFRDPSHHLSLQDSIRTTTTTTTTTTNGSASGSGSGTGNNNGNSSARSSLQRKRCISVSSQSGEILQHRKLQKQISQLSSLGDANSLLEADDLGSPYPPALPRRTDLRRSLIMASVNGAILQRADSMTDDWKDKEDLRELELRQRRTEDETELFARLVTPMHSIAELSQPTRSRLKLSRIITRRNQDLYAPRASPRVELMRTHLPGMGHVNYASAMTQQQRQPRKLRNKTHSSKTLDTLFERFRWRKRPKQTLKRENSLTTSPTTHARNVVEETGSPKSTSGIATPSTTLWNGNLQPS